MSRSSGLCNALNDYKEASVILRNCAVELDVRLATACPLLQHPDIEPTEQYQALLGLLTHFTPEAPYTEDRLAALIGGVDGAILLFQEQANAIKEQIADLQEQITTLHTTLGIALQRLSNALSLRIDQRITAYEFNLIRQSATELISLATDDEKRLFNEMHKLQQHAFGQS
ncbi:hypothetical protein [Paludibaculum fermentans]|uniref:hypothetical protein n=1 Tax=Paludibaculum fermentans TaxID=1473598 RepID=UPI003EBBF4D3